MENRPGKQQMGNSKLTEKYQAGRGRALKEFSRRSPKAEEVERRKQLQQLILSGKIILDKETIEKHFHSGQNGSTCGSVSSSSKKVQLGEVDTDSTLDLISDTNSSKVPVGSVQLPGDFQSDTLLNNNLEKRMEKSNIVDNSKDNTSNSVPPRFQNSQWGKNFKKK